MWLWRFSPNFMTFSHHSILNAKKKFKKGPALETQKRLQEIGATATSTALLKLGAIQGPKSHFSSYPVTIYHVHGCPSKWQLKPRGHRIKTYREQYFTHSQTYSALREKRPSSAQISIKEFIYAKKLDFWVTKSFGRLVFKRGPYKKHRGKTFL